MDVTKNYAAHPAYVDSLREAGARARREPGACMHVIFDGTEMYVCGPENKKPEGKLVCIAQVWDDLSVHLRFGGAHTEWLYV
jgi:hypothetical protein